MKSHTKQLRIAYTKAKYICSMILARYLKTHDKAGADAALLKCTIYILQQAEQSQILTIERGYRYETNYKRI